MKSRFYLAGAVFAVLAQLGALAHADDIKTITKAENKQDFAAVAAAIQKNMQPGGRYQSVSAQERTDIDARLADMQSIFDKYGTVDAMDQNAKTQFFNDQEYVNKTLTHDDDNRLICTSVAPTGSNIPKRICKTYGEIKREERDAQYDIMIQSQRNQPSGGSFSVGH